MTQIFVNMYQPLYTYNESNKNSSWIEGFAMHTNIELNNLSRSNKPWLENLSKTAREPQIIAVGGGKGGVGKSLVLSNMAISLALKGYKVVALDLDLGGANLHTCLDTKIPEQTLSDLMLRKVSNINQLLTPTPVPNLSLICGAQDELGMANLRNQFKSRIFSNLKHIDADYILFDLGAGTANNTLDFFNASSKGLLVCLPEPTSIENTYRFIKSALYREINAIDGIYTVQSYIERAFNSKASDNAPSPREVFEDISERFPQLGHKISKVLKNFSPLLVINQARNKDDIEIGKSMAMICKRYFGINMKSLGHLSYDASAWQCIKKRKPLLLEFSHSTIAKDFDVLMKNLLQ